MFFRFYIDIVSEWVYDVDVDTVSEVLLQVMVLPKGSPEQTITRKRTIISACKTLSGNELYGNHDLDDRGIYNLFPRFDLQLFLKQRKISSSIFSTILFERCGSNEKEYCRQTRH